jgi:hypothetical protein
MEYICDLSSSKAALPVQKYVVNIRLYKYGYAQVKLRKMG